MTVRIARDDAEVAAALAVRRAVFVEEQGIDPEIDRDGRDDVATHVIAVADEQASERSDDDADLHALDGGPVVGTARLREPEPGVARGERLAVAEPYRGEGYGHEVTERLIDEAARRDCARLVVHAQADNVAFCRAHGFETVGEPFEEAGIEHREMHHDLARTRGESARPTEESPPTE